MTGYYSLMNLPLEIQQMVASELNSVDIRSLGRTCHAMQDLIHSPALKAAWLWRQRGDMAILTALDFIQDAALMLFIIRQLLDVYHVDVHHGCNKGLLQTTCERGHADVVQLLLNQPGIQIYAADQRGLTSLHKACSEGHADVVQLLLNQPGIQINAADQAGGTSLHVACFQGHADVVQLLLNQPGIQVNAAGQDGMTSLHLACANGDAGVVRVCCL